MDFSLFTQKAKELGAKLWTQMKENTDKALAFWSEALQKSSFVVQSATDFEELVAASENKTSPSGKVYQKRSLLIIGNPQSDFFKTSLYALPVIYWKAWSQNTLVKLMSSEISGIDYGKYALVFNELPCCVVFGDKKVVKIIAWEKNINTLVKSLSLDILGTIDTL